MGCATPESKCTQQLRALIALIYVLTYNYANVVRCGDYLNVANSYANPLFRMRGAIG